MINKYSKLFNFIKNNKTVIFLISVIFIQLIFRVILYPEHNIFLFDQRRDLLLVENSIENHELLLAGPIQAHTKGVFLGPLYYYFHSIFSIVLGGNPYASSIMVQLFFLTSIIILFFAAKKLVSFQFAFLAVIIYSFNESILFFTLFGWNINIIFPFLISLFYYFFAWLRDKKLWQMIAIMLLAGILGQLHLYMIPVVFFVFILGAFYHFRVFIKQLWTMLFAIILYIPYIIYDFQNKHEQITRLHAYLMTVFQGDSNNNIGSVLLKIYLTFKITFTQFFFSRLIINLYPSLNSYLTLFSKLLIIFLIVLLIILFIKKRHLFSYSYIKKNKLQIPFLFLFMTGFISKVFFSPFDQYRHYFFLFILLAIIFSYIINYYLDNKNKRIRVTALILLIFYLAINILMFNKGIANGSFYNYKQEGQYLYYKTDHVILDNISKIIVFDLKESNFKFKNISKNNDKNKIIDLEIMKYYIKYYSNNQIIYDSNSKNIIYIGFINDFEKVDKNSLFFIDLDSYKPLGIGIEITKK